jgi:hypothetical protein
LLRQDVAFSHERCLNVGARRFYIKTLSLRLAVQADDARRAQPDGGDHWATILQFAQAKFKQ